MGPNWIDCSTTIPGCWLKNTVTGEQLDVTTDYEDAALTPNGTIRNYTLYVTENNTINADGLNFTDARMFNGIFPGPLLEACWGDTVNVTVVNNMTFNGTSIHWHGIRQWKTMHMDGVNGITQCPIAPGDSFSYVWKVMQYGSSWYHSHYSVQYADGLQGPITLHGPTTIPYDTAISPLITSDWLHNSAFQAELSTTTAPTILLNGTGNITRFYGHNTPSNPTGFNSSTIPKGFEITFNSTSPNNQTGARRYLLRIINTSYSTEITFSIDNHYLVVVEADFVPVLPKNVTSILVAIGQRYHIIVEAQPATLGAVNPIEPNGNYWIRTNTSGCFDDIKGTINGFERTGILRYTNSTSEPTSSTWPDIAELPDCYDSLSGSLQTAYNWTVTAPQNGLSGSLGQGGELFNVKFNSKGNTPQYAAAFVNFQRSPNADFTPFQTTYGNPTFLNLDNTADAWPVGWVVVPENYTDNDFVC
ncbi:hypothetical protein CLAIMM_02879 [Cladophialophora immunda]|nr:hypothetical protein CLAIMM_02879 [Cladophialophora immunda]